MTAGPDSKYGEDEPMLTSADPAVILESTDPPKAMAAMRLSSNVVADEEAL